MRIAIRRGYSRSMAMWLLGRRILLTFVTPAIQPIARRPTIGTKNLLVVAVRSTLHLLTLVNWNRVAFVVDYDNWLANRPRVRIGVAPAGPDAGKCGPDPVEQIGCRIAEQCTTRDSCADDCRRP